MVTVPQTGRMLGGHKNRPQTRSVLKRSTAALFLLTMAVPPPGGLDEANAAVHRSSDSDPTGERDIGLRDVIEMRLVDSLSVAPDGRSVGFRVISPSIQTNSVSARWFKMSLDAPGKPIALGKAAAPIYRPLFDMVADGISQWDENASSLYVLEQDRSIIGIHRLRPGGGDKLVTHDAADIVDFRLSRDARQIRYQVRADRGAIDRAQALEEEQGVHLDKTVFADGMRLTGSFRIGQRMLTIRDTGGVYPEQAFAGPVRTHSAPLPRPSIKAPLAAAGDDRTGMNPFQQVLVEKRSLPVITSQDGTNFHLDPVSSDSPSLAARGYRLSATSASGGAVSCTATPCTGSAVALRQVLVDHENNSAIILREDHGSGQTRVYGWSPRDTKVRSIYFASSSLNGGSSTTGAGCLLANTKLVCVESAPAIAPRLVAIDIRTGKERVLADPNKAFALRHYPQIREMQWVDAAGNPSSGILVLPSRAAGPLPLVLTTYGCRGFLHGGTSMLTPELMLAQRGIAALCVNFDSTLAGTRDDDGKEMLLGQHRAEIEVYRAAIQLLASRGLIDPERVGISGHSFSAMIIAYAISHTDLFRAASMGDGVLTDPMSFYVRAQLPESEGRSAIAGTGLPPVDDDPRHLWAQVSAALNADRITAPVLMQPPENEWLCSLQLYTALRDLHRPTDMYVYPNAGHMLSRYPLQQYTRAKRSVDWLTFWLTGKEYRGGSLDQYRDWEDMRSEVAHRLRKKS